MSISSILTYAAGKDYLLELEMYSVFLLSQFLIVRCKALFDPTSGLQNINVIHTAPQKFYSYLL